MGRGKFAWVSTVYPPLCESCSRRGRTRLLQRAPRPSTLVEMRLSGPRR